jgi:hypothetical protein
MNILMLLSTCIQDGLRDFSIITVKYRTELRKTGWISLDIDVDCMQDTLEINGSYAGPYLRTGHRGPGPGQQISGGSILKKIEIEVWYAEKKGLSPREKFKGDLY